MSKSKPAQPGFFSFENIRSIVVLVVVIFAIRWTIASPYHVPTSSMEPTIKVGDRLLAWKLAYNFKLPFTDIVLWDFKKPQRGDIIVFKWPKSPDTDYVKRVVGVPGDELAIISDILYVNGKAQARVDFNHERAVLDDIEDQKENKILFRENLEGVEHWVMQNVDSLRSPLGSNWPVNGESTYKVPENSVFCIGDNRDNSHDSRMWGEVPMSYIRGKALFVIWSLYDGGASGSFNLRWKRFGHWLDEQPANDQASKS